MKKGLRILLKVLAGILIVFLAALAATVLGLLWYALDKMQLRLGRDSFVITKSNMMEVLQVGAPKTAESLVNNTTNILQRIFIIMGAGTIGVMLYNLPWRFVGLAVVPIEALGAAYLAEKDGSPMPEPSRLGIPCSTV